MKKYFLLLFFISFTVYSFGQIKESQAIDSIFTEWNKTDVPGCSLGIIKEGQLIYAKGYSMANMDYDIPNSASSVFRIGSTSKQSAAACIILLAEKGKLDIDDNLKSLFPDFPDYAEKITVELGLVSFQRTDGRVSSFKLDSGRVKNLYFEKK